MIFEILMLHQAVTFWRIMGCQICANSLGGPVLFLHDIFLCAQSPYRNDLLVVLTDMIGIAKLELELAI